MYYFLLLLYFFKPYIIGVITPNRTISEWRNVFYISCGFLTFTNIVYIIWGSAEKQDWDKPEETKSVEIGIQESYRRQNEDLDSSKG